MGGKASTNGAARRLLSARELEVLTLVARGLSTDGIAAELFVSRNTVRSHVGHILEKLRARNRAHAVGIGVAAGFIWIDDHASTQHHHHARLTEAMVIVAAGRDGPNGTQ
jgi:DNA-binding CsgD family transcriptional regulator